MVKDIVQMLFGRVIWFCFACLLAYVSIGMIINYASIESYAFTTLSVIIGVFLIFSAVHEIKRITKQYPLKARYEEYIESMLYETVHFTSPHLINETQHSAKFDKCLMVYHPTAEFVCFRKTSSPIPGRYDFYVSEDDKFIYVIDKYDSPNDKEFLYTRKS